ncbi:hypothetical protein HMPREF0201_00710 [Cedecea davisae DSM 4568]|uniref:Prophage protein n=2 Tax=Cedecea davisae TaxID=158484 RepID=S3J4G5_9ENTR|nr:hypothetical protein HMPREF0201_00710 [Cedecea davisae DSM 4568]
MILVIISFIATKITVQISGGTMSKQSVKPVLLSEVQIQAIRNIQELQRKQSGIGVAPTIHEIARGLVDKALAIHSEMKVSA